MCPHQHACPWLSPSIAHSQKAAVTRTEGLSGLQSVIPDRSHLSTKAEFTCRSDYGASREAVILSTEPTGKPFRKGLM